MTILPFSLLIYIWFTPLVRKIGLPKSFSGWGQVADRIQAPEITNFVSGIFQLDIRIISFYCDHFIIAMNRQWVKTVAGLTPMAKFVRYILTSAYVETGTECIRIHIDTTLPSVSTTRLVLPSLLTIRNGSSEPSCLMPTMALGVVQPKPERPPFSGTVMA